MKVFVVGDHGPEHNSISSVHRTHEGALKAWNEMRLSLLENAKSCISKKHVGDMYKRMAEALSCDDPEKIDNYPHETPYIWDYDVVD